MEHKSYSLKDQSKMSARFLRRESYFHPTIQKGIRKPIKRFRTKYIHILRKNA